MNFPLFQFLKGTFFSLKVSSNSVLCFNATFHLSFIPVLHRFFSLLNICRICLPFAKTVKWLINAKDDVSSIRRGEELERRGEGRKERQNEGEVNRRRGRCSCLGCLCANNYPDEIPRAAQKMSVSWGISHDTTGKRDRQRVIKCDINIQ